MGTRLQDVQKALDVKLSTLPDLPDVAWENIKYSPNPTTTFIRPTLLPGSSALNEIDGRQVNIYVYSINIFVPLNKGKQELLVLLDAIYDLYSANKDLSQGDTKIFLRQIETIATLREENFFQGSINITVNSYST